MQIESKACFSFTGKTLQTEKHFADWGGALVCQGRREKALEQGRAVEVQQAASVAVRVGQWRVRKTERVFHQNLSVDEWG